MDYTYLGSVTRYLNEKRFTITFASHLTAGINEQSVVVAQLAQPWSSLVVGDEGPIGPSGKLLCLCQSPKNYGAHAWHYSIHVLLLGRSSCSSLL